MSIGYSSALYAFPCDQRQRLVEDVFGWHEPLDAKQLAAVSAVKGVLYAGFRQASDQTMTKREALLVCDDQYGAPTLAHAIDHDYLTALSLERSDDDELRFERNDVEPLLEEWRVNFGKVRLRFDIRGDEEMHGRILHRLRQLQIYLSERDRLMIVDLMAPEDDVVRAVEMLQDGGADPDLWIVPPLVRSDDELLSALVRRDGREEVSCLVRVQGTERARMRAELQAAAMAPAFVGFSVEPDAFADVTETCRGPDASFADCAARVAARYADWIETFRSARVSFVESTGAFLS